jgi:hypothetical protein
MKRFSYLGALALTFLLCSFSFNNPLIVKKWKFDPKAVEKMLQDEAKKEGRTATKEEIDFAMTLFSGITWDFQSGGKLVLTGMGESSNSTWSLSKDNKKLTVESPEGSMVFDVKELSANKLVISALDPESGQITELGFIPA